MLVQTPHLKNHCPSKWTRAAQSVIPPGQFQISIHPPNCALRALTIRIKQPSVLHPPFPFPIHAPVLLWMKRNNYQAIPDKHHPALRPVLTCVQDGFAKGVSYRAQRRTQQRRKSPRELSRSGSLARCVIPQSWDDSVPRGTVPGNRCDLVFSSLTYPDALPQRAVTAC